MSLSRRYLSRNEIRSRLAGRHVLFVSNRHDPGLRARIKAAFGIDTVWCVAEPRRIAAACGRISRGGYDIVFGITGFLSHATDSALARASRAASTPYIRVDRGRVAACERALTRELGLLLPGSVSRMTRASGTSGSVRSALHQNAPT